MPLLILIVDDELEICRSTVSALEKFGYSAIAASNGKVALRLIEENCPHLIITDLAMPEIDGYELIRRVRQHKAFRLLPIIFLTDNSADTQERIHAYQLGGDTYLSKPFELEELLVVVRNLLNHSQLIRWEWRLQMQLHSLESQIALADTMHSALNQQELTPQTNTLDRKSTINYTSIAQVAAQQEIYLTRREQAVIKLLAEGLQNCQIATRLHLSRRTVEKYVSNLLSKTETKNRVELMRFAIEHNLIDY